MEISLNQKIDLSNYDEKDLTIEANVSSLLSVQFELNGGSAIFISGKNINSDNFVTLIGVDATTMSTVSEIKNDGIYNFDISGVDIIKININENNTSSIICIRITD